MKTIKIVSWEVTKVIIIFTCLVILCCNVILMAKFNHVDRGLDAIWDEMSTNHEEIINKLDTLK